jgi:hypothetical protein
MVGHHRVLAMAFAEDREDGVADREVYIVILVACACIERHAIRRRLVQVKSWT